MPATNRRGRLRVAVTTPSCSNVGTDGNAGPDQSAQTLDAVSFDGSASSDPDGTISSYVWTFGDQGAPAYSPTATHAYASSGTYTVTLTVTDNQVRPRRTPRP